MEIQNLIVYFCDFSPDNTEVGPESLARINKAIEYILSNQDTHYYILLGAGLFKGNGKIAKYLAAKKIASLLREKGFKREFSQIADKKILKLGQLEVEILTAKTQAWGTYAETLAIWESFKILLMIFKTKIFSSKYHILRLKFIWLFLLKSEREFLGVKVKRTSKERFSYYLRELTRYAKALALGFRLKFS